MKICRLQILDERFHNSKVRYFNARMYFAYHFETANLLALIANQSISQPLRVIPESLLTLGIIRDCRHYKLLKLKNLFSLRTNFSVARNPLIQVNVESFGHQISHSQHKSDCF